MALQRDRTRVYGRGLGKAEAMEIEPSPATAFSNLGYLKESEILDDNEMEEVEDENGQQQNYLEKSQKAGFRTRLLQTSVDEIDFVRNAGGKIHAVRYSGLTDERRAWQYFCWPRARFNPSMRLLSGGREERTIDLLARALKRDELAYDVPLYYVAQAARAIRTENLQLWIVPRHGYTAGTNRVLDVSGHERHGQLNSDFASIWQTGTTPERFLRFDGVNDQGDFGDVLNFNATDDIHLEVWSRVQSADGTTAIMAAKKQNGGAANPGWYLRRDSAGNVITFILGDASSYVQLSSVATLLQNVWKHIAVSIDRDGNAQVYVNGVASGTPASVAGIGNSSNALSLFLARDNAGSYANLDLGSLRVYNYGGGGLPSSITTIISDHYNAERGFFGV